MSKLTKLVLDRPIAIIVSVMALILFGVSSITGMSLELYPQTSYPMLMVTTFYQDAGAEEVEKLVTEKIEENCGTVSGLKQMSSTSSENYSEVTFTYVFGTDLNQARSELAEALENAKEEFPDGVKAPSIVSMNSNADASISLAIDATDSKNLYKVVKNRIVPELKKINQAAAVKFWGGSDDYISIELYPERIIQYGLSISDVADKIAASNYVSTAGSVAYGEQIVNLDSKLEYKNIDAIKTIPIALKSNEIIHVSDVANVHYASAKPVSYSRFNGKESFTIDITKKQRANVITLSKEVKRVVAEVTASNPEIKINVISDASETIVKSIQSIASTLALGIVLSMAVLLLFFGDIKASLIVGSSMPVSLLATVILMAKMGFSLNLITMSALVIGIGMMVDNSIVVIETCFRKSDEGFSFYEAAYEGTKLVIGSVIASTLTTVVVYLPMAGLKGSSGQMYSSLGYTIVFALVASLISSITLVPICFSKYKPVEKKSLPINHMLDVVGNWYQRTIVKILDKKVLVTLITIALLGVSVYMATFLKTEMMETEDERQVALTMTFKPGSSLNQMDEVARHVEEFVKTKTEVENYSTTVSKESANAIVNAYLKKNVKQSTQQVVNAWNKELAGYDVRCNIKASMSDPEGMGDMGSETSKEIVLKSSDIANLKEGLSKIEEAVAKTPGVLIVENSYSQGGIKAEISVDPEYAQSLGFDLTGITEMISNHVSGKKALDVTVGESKYEARIEVPAEFRDDMNAVSNMLVTNENGESVALSQIAKITFQNNPMSITRTNGQFEGSVKATLTEDKAEAISAQLDQEVSKIALPDGTVISESSSQEDMEEEFQGIGKAIFAAIILVFMVMAIQFESIKNSLLVMFCMPFSMIGAIGLLFATSSKISTTTLMGFLMLGGIVVNNGILFVDTTNIYRQTMELKEALALAGATRLRPILMTTMTTILSMIPMVIPKNGGGDSIKGMALVIIGGLITSTNLTLVLLPTFYLIVHDHRPKTKRIKGDRRERKTRGQHDLKKS